MQLFGMSYLKDYSDPCKNAKPLVGSDPILAFQCQIFEGSQPPGKNRKKKNTTVISSNPQIHAAFWHELFEGFTQPCKNNPQKRWSAVIVKYLGISVPNIFRITTATKARGQKKPAV